MHIVMPAGMTLGDLSALAASFAPPSHQFREQHGCFLFDPPGTTPADRRAWTKLDETAFREYMAASGVQVFHEDEPI